MAFSERLFDEAECREIDPRIFDQSRGNIALVALDHCLGCSVVDLCNEWVKPEEASFTGVAAGRVWSEGFDVTAMTLEEVDRQASGESHASLSDVHSVVDWRKVRDMTRGIPDAARGSTALDRIAAIEAMVAGGLDSATIGERVKMSANFVRKARQKADERLGPDADQARNIGRAIHAFG